MASPQTFRDMLGVKPSDVKVSENTLLVIDAQREYVDGNVKLTNIEPAMEALARILKRARKAGIKIIHFKHHAPKGAPVFDPDGPYVEIAEPARPEDGELIIVKHFPDAFIETGLKEQLQGSPNLIVAGFMTHACISATVRSAGQAGFNTTVIANACATRDLPDKSKNGAMVPAAIVHQANLAALADLFAQVLEKDSDLKD
jgi:nicotinamidase-related amidase